MKFRFTIGRRIGTGFGALIILTLGAFVATNLTLKNGREKTHEVTAVYTPSISALKELFLIVVRGKMYITNWVYIQNPDDVPGKEDMRKLLRKEYPALKANIKDYETNWTNLNTKKTVDSLFVQIDSLFYTDHMIMQQLNSFASYEDASVEFLMRPLVDEDGPVTLQSISLQRKLKDVIQQEQDDATQVTTQMLDSFSTLDRIV